jgi:photosystem II stability/assembly factor-like uncharacterized protein
MAIDPGDGLHTLAANNSAGLLAETNDGGQNWTWRGSGLLGTDAPFAFGCLAFAPSDPRTVYAGTISMRPAGVLDATLPGKGLFISRDGGQTWAPANDATSAKVQAADIAVDPSNPQIAYVAALNNGLLRTTDGGQTWKKSAGRWPKGAVVQAVAFRSGDLKDLFVGTDSGLFRTSDGGTTWKRLAGGLPPESEFTSIVADPIDPQILYVADHRSGVYRSLDGGERWEPISTGLSMRTPLCLSLSGDGNHLYVGTDGAGVFRLDLNGSSPPVIP